jgi:hypothetical protein
MVLSTPTAFLCQPWTWHTAADAPTVHAANALAHSHISRQLAQMSSVVGYSNPGTHPKNCFTCSALPCKDDFKLMPAMGPAIDESIRWVPRCL